MRRRTTFGLAACLAVLANLDAAVADWPQWRGPRRDGVSEETGLLKTWPKEGPKLLWTYDKAGLGYAGFAVVGGTVYTMGTRGEDEYALAIGPDGKEKWATKIGPIFDFKGNTWSRGPNGTPSVDGELVFALGSQGEMVCVERASGEFVWRKNFRKDLAGEVSPVIGGPEKMGWGYCWSPLVDGDKLVCVPGGPKGLFAALDKKRGKVLWRSKGVPDQATYSSPVAFTAGGVRQYVCVVQDGVVGVSAEDGALLWRHKREEPYPDVVCPTPLCKGNQVYVTVGYGGGALLLEVTGKGKEFKAEVKYAQQEIGNKLGGVVRVGENVFGYHEDRAWLCQEFESGKLIGMKRNPARALKSGAVVAAEGRLYILDETGGVGMLPAKPMAKYTELGRFQLPKQSERRKSGGKVWTHPVISDGKLYLRDQEYIFCYQVK
jgi:outer membrane protein assembly factor BamB